MEQLAIFEEKVILTPSDLRPEIESFDDILLAKLKATLEGKCSKHGYVIPKSLELLSRSMGAAEKGHFTSDFLYYMKVQGKVYNPPDGLEVEGEVIRKNKMGLYVIIEDAIRIMVPRDLHIGNTEFDSVEDGQDFEFEVVGAQFKQMDKVIIVVGRLRTALKPAPLQPLLHAVASVELPNMNSSMGTDSEEKVVTITNTSEAPKKTRKLKKHSVVDTNESLKIGVDEGTT